MKVESSDNENKKNSLREVIRMRRRLIRLRRNNLKADYNVNYCKKNLAV